MILHILSISSVIFIPTTVILAISLYNSLKDKKSTYNGIDKEIERAERILNNIVTSMRKK